MWGEPLKWEQELGSWVLSWVFQAGRERDVEAGKGGSGQSSMGTDSWGGCNMTMVSFSPRSGKLNIWFITVHSRLEQRKCNWEQRCKIPEEMSGWGETAALRLQMQPATASEPHWPQGAVCWWLGVQAVSALRPSSPGLLKVKNWDGLVVPS